MRSKNEQFSSENPVDRIVRVNEILKREIADVLQKLRINENGGLISVTRVQCASNLKNADVFVSLMGIKSEEEQNVMNRLNRLRSDIQHSVSKHVILKYTPVLHFIIDRSVAEGDRVLALLQELENEEAQKN